MDFFLHFQGQGNAGFGFVFDNPHPPQKIVINANVCNLLNNPFTLDVSGNDYF